VIEHRDGPLVFERAARLIREIGQRINAHCGLRPRYNNGASAAAEQHRILVTIAIKFTERQSESTIILT